MANNTNNTIEKALEFKALPLEFALFIDNDINQINRVKNCGSKMDVLHVGGYQTEVPVLSWENDAMKRFQENIQKGPGGKAFLEEFKTKFEGDTYDPTSGIRQEHCDFIKRWVNEKPSTSKLSVLFDYDRTLTVIEGTNLTEIDNEGFVEYYLGGIARVTMLRDLFTFLYERNVKMYVLTNNTACGSRALDSLFREVVLEIFSPYPVEIICGQAYNFDKWNAAATLLSEVCQRNPGQPVKGGKRKTRHRQKQKQKKRKTKKYTSKPRS